MRDLIISKKLLKIQYETMKVLDIMKYYDICSDKLYGILDEIGIKRKGKERTNIILKDWGGNMQILGFTIGDIDGDINIFQEDCNGDTNVIILAYEEVSLFIKCLKSVVNDG